MTPARMRPARREALLGSLVIALAAGLMTSAGQSAASGSTASRQAPAFVGKTIDGGRFSLASARGKIVVLDFLLPGCPECVVQAPMLERVAGEYAGRGVSAVIVDITGGPIDLLRDYYRGELALGKRLTIVADGTKRPIARAYKVDFAGVTFVIGRQGQILSRFRWLSDPSVIRRQLDRALRGRR